MAALSRYFGTPKTRQSLISGLPLLDGCIDEHQLVIVAERAGLTCRPLFVSITQISDLELPALLVLKDQQACVLVKKQGSNLTILTAAGGKQQIELAALQDNDQCRAYCIQPSIDYEAGKHYQAPVGHWLWSLAWQHKGFYFEAALGSVVVNLLALALPLFIMAVYDRIIPNFALESLIVLVSGMLLVAVIDFTLRQLRAYVLDQVGRRIDTFMGNIVFNHLLRSKIQQSMSSGATANAMRELDVLREFMNSSTLSLLSDVPFVFLFVFAISVIGGVLAWVPVIFIPLVLFIFLITQWPLHRLMHKAYENASHRNAVLFEILNGLESVKALGAESWAASKWEKAHAAGVKTAFASRFYNLCNQHILMFLQTMASVCIIGLGVFQIEQGNLSFGALFAAIILNGRAMAPVSQIAQVIGRFHGVMVAYKSINHLMAMPLERPTDHSQVSCPTINGNIVCDNVNFAYPIMGQLSEAKTDVLRDVSCSINHGEKIAIVGTIGSGKSTLLKLFLNIISPDSGTIRIDGIDSRELDSADLRSQIGYVPQNLHFFQGTIKDNITIHHPDTPLSRINRAAALAGIDGWLSTCALGLAQPVGERGDTLSGGQKQSLALARALVNDPRILLMDEPTSLLDSQVEMQFLQRLNQVLADKTLIVVTHRPAMLNIVDRIIVINQGRIVLDGPKQSVLAKLGNPT